MIALPETELAQRDYFRAENSQMRSPDLAEALD
jgi:hypothetical protein